MRIDFSTPMTFYELLAIVLAAIAIIIPIGQAAYKKWFITPKLCFFPTGRALLFFNQSGSYIRIDGVYEAENKPITIRKILRLIFMVANRADGMAAPHQGSHRCFPQY